MSYTKRSQFDFFYSYGKIMNTGGISMKKIRWEKMYEYAKKYYNHHGNLEVPHDFKTNNGYEYDKDGELDLGYWITKQMVLVNPNSEKGKKLIQIGMKFKKQQHYKYTWEEWYEYAKRFYDFYGHLNVPERFKTNNGYEYDKEGRISLGSWIQRQRTICDPNSKQGLLLQQIGMDFDKKKYIRLSWKEMYEYARLFYYYHGHLEIPFSFKTNNGYEACENGMINLGVWIHHQRSSCNPDSEKGKKLIQIGMRFTNVQNHRKEMQSLCKESRIDYIKNKEILSYISIHDFKNKVNYLSSLEIPLIDREGRLHEFFFMTPFDLENRYQKRKRLF